MATKKSFLIWWLGGIAIFAISLTLHSPLAIEAVPGGILDHQAAPDAAAVNAIQGAWEEADLIGQARLAMISDLIFIGVYGVGCVLGGLDFKSRGSGALIVMGWIAAAMGVVFLFTDYVETALQFVQLIRFEGSDTLAGVASSMGPFKVLSFLVAAGVLIVALVWERFVQGSSK